uniref:PTS system mannose/fructose/N-acetylgalactosamine-transporter subunit IIB n=1 Tax=Parolsenella massiliensis TaxID=1871022 RepID=UPI00093396DB|nr:PTS sugar transporter subunit IIB [Parolsenella massiliensis]
MIELLRVDDRLIHGQVAVTWTSHLGADTIVVANDKAAKDTLMQSAFKLAKPPQVVLSIKSVAGAILVINNPKHASRKIFVVCASPKDAACIVAECPEVKHVCLGGVRQAGERKQIAPQVYLDQEEVAALDDIEAHGCKVTLQSVPDQSPMDLAAIKRAFAN